MTLGNEMHDAGKKRDETYVCCGLDMVTKINRVADGIGKNARSTETQWVGAWPKEEGNREQRINGMGNRDAVRIDLFRSLVALM